MEEKPRKTSTLGLMDQGALGLFVWLMSLQIGPGLAEWWSLDISASAILYAATGLGLAVPLIGWAASAWRGR